jgi:hypothetical protein
MDGTEPNCLSHGMHEYHDLHLISRMSLNFPQRMLRYHFQRYITAIFVVLWPVSFQERFPFYRDPVLSPLLANPICLHPNKWRWSCWTKCGHPYDTGMPQSGFQKSLPVGQSRSPSLILPIQSPLCHVHHPSDHFHVGNHETLKTVLLRFHQPRFLPRAKGRSAQPVSNVSDHE